MDAMTVLDNVAATYRGLRTLAADVRVVTESGDEGGSHRSESRLRALYAAPDRVRVEQPGSRGWVTMTDGLHFHHYAAPVKRYAKHAVNPAAPLPGLFRPEFPGSTQEFLFHRIAERVLEARLIEGPGVGVEVRYETLEGPFPQVGPVRFVVDPETWLIGRWSCVVEFRDPHMEHRQAVAMEFENQLNGSVPEHAFVFTPPPDAIDISWPGQQGGFVHAGGGGGVSGPMPGGGDFERRGSHEWEGETLVARETIRIRGVEAAFERRFTLEPGKGLVIREKIRGPKSEVTREAVLALG